MTADQFSLARPNAWLLDFGSSLRAAVGTRVLLQIIENPELHPIPCTPPYCNSILLWQGRLLPVMDLGARLNGLPQTPRLLAVIGFQDQPGKPTHFGALLLTAPPVAIAVRDTQSCPLPNQPTLLNKFSISCFIHQEVSIPVLHLEQIFSASASPAP
jgi:chemotaxis signal transduction protein